MTREDALELIERMPFITTIKAPHRKARLEIYRACVESDDPVEWIRVIKSCYIAMNYGGISPTDEEMRHAGAAKQRLEDALAAALELGPNSGGEDVEAFIQRHIEENI